MNALAALALALRLSKVRARDVPGPRRETCDARCRRLRRRVHEQQRAGCGIDDIIMPVLRMVDGVLPGRRRPALEGEELLDGPVEGAG